MTIFRRPRFRRQTNSSSLQLTERDRQIIRHVFRHRFLRSTHILALVDGSKQQTLRRLQGLYHHGYLDRPRAQIDYYRRGSRAMVYGLGNKGMALLENEDGIPKRKLDWTAGNRTAMRHFIEHTLAVAEVMVAVECSCRGTDTELIPYSDTAFKWNVPVRYDNAVVTVGIIPDRVFGLRNKKQPAEIAWIFLEADRATMPVQRRSLKQTSFARKLLAYHETWQRKVLAADFPRFRVLTVTTSPERVENLLNANCSFSQGKGSGLFLFTDQREFHHRTNVLSQPIINGRGELITLVE